MSVHKVPNFSNPLCAEVDPEIFFASDSTSDQRKFFTATEARKVCNRCEHKIECGEYSLQNRVMGIWGGLSEMERRKIRRERGIVAREISSTSILGNIRDYRRRESQ